MRASARGTAKGFRSGGRKAEAKDPSGTGSKDASPVSRERVAGSSCRTIPNMRSLSEPWLWRTSHWVPEKPSFDGSPEPEPTGASRPRPEPGRKGPGQRCTGSDRTGRAPEPGFVAKPGAPEETPRPNPGLGSRDRDRGGWPQGQPPFSFGTLRSGLTSRLSLFPAGRGSESEGTLRRRTPHPTFSPWGEGFRPTLSRGGGFKPPALRTGAGRGAHRGRLRPADSRGCLPRRSGHDPSR